MSKFIQINSYNGIIQKDYTSLIRNSLKISHRILFQCTAISNSFLAIGCNTGNIYVFNIQNSKFKYWSNIISNDASISGMQFSKSKHYLAYHNKKCQIFIYKLNLVNEKNLMIRQIDNAHNSPVQALLWDEECSKIFCGYFNGVVDIVYVPQNAKDYFHVPSEGMLKLDRQDIIQMDFMKDLLLVSTNEKVILINIQSKYMTFIGTKPRSGQYGACFWYDDSKHLRIVSARPGYRLWIASVDGTVEETHQYKTWNNSRKYKIKDDEITLSGTGQYCCLSMIKNTNLLVAIESEGFLFIIDLIKKSTVAVVDYGTSLSKILCNTDIMILNSQREVVSLTVSSFKEALAYILEEDGDSKSVIDLFLTLACESEDIKQTEIQIDNREIFNTLSPDLLARVVQKSAESEYRFNETNKLQVCIQDNREYQSIFLCVRNSEINLERSPTSILESLNDGSTESDCSNDPGKRGRKIAKRPDKMRGFVKTPQLLQTIFDKTSHFLSNMDVLSSSNSDIHLNMTDSISERMSNDNVNEIDSIGHESIMDNMPENIMPSINLMELEANGYIASEKYKQLHIADDNRDDFLKSLSNFCETWLILNLQHWQQLSRFELHVRNLSATFPIFISKISVSSNDSSNMMVDDKFMNEQLQVQFANSWSSTINVADWMKMLPISDKIYQMISILLSYCFFYDTFCNFSDLICHMMSITSANGQSPIDDGSVQVYVNEYYDGVRDIEIQTMNLSTIEITVVERYGNTRYGNLVDVLVNKIWRQESDTIGIGYVIKHFHDFLNIKSIRQWMRSGISHNVWSIALSNFKDISSLKSQRDHHKNFTDMSKVDLEKILFDSLCADTIYSFVIVDEILSIMIAQDTIDWKLLIESESLDCRDVLHFSLKYELDLTDYIVQLFKHVDLSIKFSSRLSLLEHIYSQSDVVIALVYSLLLNKSTHEKELRNCDCGLLRTYSELSLPDNVHSLAIEILNWGADRGIFKNDLELFQILVKLCIDACFDEGYIELLVGMSKINDLVKIGVQVANVHILERLKDCAMISLSAKIDIILSIIDCRRKQVRGSNDVHCIGCDKIIAKDITNIRLLSWTDIGQLIFLKLIDEVDLVAIMQEILPKLSHHELDQMKELLTESLQRIMHSNKTIDRNQMLKFIKAEMCPDDVSGDLTERYLNVYTMTRHELSGPNWGRIITDNMLCDLCGMRLINKVDVDGGRREIIGFCCNHTFHRDCFLQFGPSDDCFLC